MHLNGADVKSGKKYLQDEGGAQWLLTQGRGAAG